MTVYIIGGGIAGLAAAVGCAERGLSVQIYESAPRLGGRCRSYTHDDFGCELDNGAHAVLANNTSIMRYLNAIGARDELQCYGADGLKFHDVRNGADWRLEVPQCLWRESARPPGISAFDILSGVRALFSKGSGTSALRADPEAIEKLWEPLCTSALNTPLNEADSQSLASVLRGMSLPNGLRQGLWLPRTSLSETYITPAEKWLTAKGAKIHRQSPARAMKMSHPFVEEIVIDHQAIRLTQNDVVILAVPPWSALLAQVGISTQALNPSPIINVHFKLPIPAKNTFTGFIGGTSQWLWARGNIATVTISAADSLLAHESGEIARRVWSEAGDYLKYDGAIVPPAHVVKERRATLRHTPGINDYRPTTRTHLMNLILAGDWLDTGLPCTLESAVQSGFTAAMGCLSR